jgi:hypothetical protein
MGGKKGCGSDALYNDATEGRIWGSRLREGGWCEGCHATGEDVGGPAPIDGQRPDR